MEARARVSERERERALLSERKNDSNSMAEEKLVLQSTPPPFRHSQNTIAQLPARSTLHLSEIEVVLDHRAWAHAEEELRIRRENAVEDDDINGDHRRGDDDGASASTSTSHSSLLASSAYCVLWCWSRAENGWRWVYTSEAVQPLLRRRRGRRRRAGGKRGGSESGASKSLVSWSPIDLSRGLLRSSREALEAAASAGVIHLHVHASTGGKNVGPCSSASAPGCRPCPCPRPCDDGGSAGGSRRSGDGDPLLLSATLRLQDAAAAVPEARGSGSSPYPSGAVVASLGPERVAWVPQSRGRRDQRGRASRSPGGPEIGAGARTAAAPPPALAPPPPPPPALAPPPPPLLPPPPPALLAAAARAAESRAKADAATRALELALEERRRGAGRTSELARAAAGDGGERAARLEQRAAALREATERSKAETERRAAALSKARRGLEACLGGVELLRAAVSGGGARSGASGGAAGAPRAPPSARAVLGSALSSLIARRCSLVAGIGEVMELTPESAVAANAASGKRQQRRRASPSSAAAAGGEDGDEPEDEDGSGDSTWDRLESGWSSGLGGIRQQEGQQQAGNGSDSGAPPPEQRATTATICGLALDPGVAGRGWQQRPHLPSRAGLDADAAALASAAEAAGAIAQVLGLPLRHPLRPLPRARGAGGGGGGGGSGAAVAFAPPPAGEGGQQRRKLLEPQASSYRSSSAPPAVVDAVGAAILFQGGAAGAPPSSSSSAAAEGASAASGGANGEGAGNDGGSGSSAAAAAPASLLPSLLLSSAAEFPLFLPGSTVGGLSSGSAGGGGTGVLGASAPLPPSSSFSASGDAAALLASATEPATGFAYAVFLLHRDVQQLLDAHGLAGSGPGLAVDGLAKLVAAAASVARLR